MINLSFTQFNKFANALSVANANFASTYTSAEIHKFSVEGIKIAIISRVKNMCDLSTEDFDIFADFIFNISNEEMSDYVKSLCNKSDAIVVR